MWFNLQLKPIDWVRNFLTSPSKGENQCFPTSDFDLPLSDCGPSARYRDSQKALDRWAGDLAIPPVLRNNSRKKRTSVYQAFPDRHVLCDDHILNPRRDIKDFSLMFSWGYYSSGAAQLSLAILANEFDQVTALRFYQRFAESVLGSKPTSQGWVIDSNDIRRLISQWDQDEHNSSVHPVSDLSTSTH